MGRITIGIMALLLCYSAVAVDVPWLYQVETDVASQGGEDRRRAAGVALVELLSRLSGVQNPDTRLPQLSAALDAPERYVRQYRYFREPSTGIGAERLGIAFEFDRAATLELIKSAGLPLWWASRPLSRAWILLRENGEYRWLLADDERGLAVVLDKAARRRGLPVQLPDANQAAAVDVGSGLTSAVVNNLLRAERGGGADISLVADLSENGAGSQADLQIWQDGEVQTLRLRDPDPDSLINQMVDRLADRLAAEYALSSDAERGGVLLRIEGVATPAQYADLLRYLNRLAFVDSANVESIKGGVLSLVLATSAPPDRLLQLLDSDGHLVRHAVGVIFDTTETAANGYRVRWLGGVGE